ncbi:proto-oncogene tyrosine-protein kinase ROS-like [Camponotus floridanus]|uniref:proto-oncogene tyrosine-protein kinase ROS-like n=1 Tax=Camponotus floridanus TaxID=104421 RepID=UPI000DC67AC1|nr:proto-oncogene tyrosine-protein kinase ROS-like [Camponotus floridanus]
MKYHFDGKIKQIVRINESFCHDYELSSLSMIIDDMNSQEPLIYLLSSEHIFVTDINVSMCNAILDKKNISDYYFQSMTIDKTNIYILASIYEYSSEFTLYVLEKKYASLKSVNAAEHIEKIIISSDKKNDIYRIYAFDKSLQPYPPMRCLTPDEKVYNFENVNAMANSIIVNLPEPVVKNGCKKYNLPTTIYTISISCLDNNLNKSEKFNVQTVERYYVIQNLAPFTEYKLKYTLSNFYFDQLSINPFDSNVISIKTNSGKLSAPENISVLALKPTIAVVHWMPSKKVNCVAVAYEVHWKSVTLVNGTQQKGKQFINMPKRTADGRFFTKINLSLPVQDYLIYVRVYPNNFSALYNESLSKIVHIYSEPSNITLSGVDINSMDISWIPNINLTVLLTLEYKEIATGKWQKTNNIKINYNKEMIYHIENLQSGTLYKFRLILRYPEYEENFTWPADERFIFSTLVYRQRRDNNERLLSSTMTDIEMEIQHEVPCQYTEFNTNYSPVLHSNPDECAITKIARNQITLTKHLCSGAFGTVFQGKVKNLEGSSTEISVAIKTLRKDVSSHEKKNLLKEAELMNHFRHKHILRLLAVCLDGDSPLLVLELMETDDLLKYLRDCRNLEASDSSALHLQDLLAMCEDVSRGCCYLEELRFVHRDLACRNCLISSRNRENRVVKIGNFGLARDIYKDDYYRVKGEDLLPVRWMAPKSLMFRTFTSRSDVWSFGVLMWEITSLGEKPYVTKTHEEVINYVRAGGKLPMTLNCPSPLYQLMQHCWSAADARPNFKFCLENIITLRKNIEDALLSPVDNI